MFEVWPPLAESPDRDGRRIEAVVALVNDSPDELVRAAIAHSAGAGRVAPPSVEPAAPGWLGFKLFGAPDRADGVLLGVVAPRIHDARSAGELASWFFLRYSDAPGRPHLRLRLLPTDGRAAALESRLRSAVGAGARRG